ncbi:MAG: diphthamide biosynthesis enzyme Dph2 [Candidatus Bathyarchaeia archaeon]
MVNDKVLEFDLEEKRLIEIIKKRKARSVLIQLPNGLKKYAINLISLIEESTKAIAYISGGACYGGCDLALQDAKALKVDLIIHYGHSQFVFKNSHGFNIAYFNTPFKLNLSDLIEKTLILMEKEKKYGLVTTTQHLHQLEDIKKLLEKNGYSVIIPLRGKFSIYNGQILGCNYSSLKSIEKEIDGCLIIGSYFHGLGATLCLDKQIILVDPYSYEAIDISFERNKLLKQRYSYINAAKTAKNIGIIIGMKIGQYKPKIAQRLRKLVKESGKNPILICMDEVVPDRVNNFTEIEAFVNTACPRVSINDASRFLKPILTPKESLVALEKLDWKDLIKQGIF